MPDYSAKVLYTLLEAEIMCMWVQLIDFRSRKKGHKRLYLQ